MKPSYYSHPFQTVCVNKTDTLSINEDKPFSEFPVDILHKTLVPKEEYEEIVLNSWRMFQIEGIAFPPFRSFTNLQSGLEYYASLYSENDPGGPFIQWNTYCNPEDLIASILNFWYNFTDKNPIIQYFSTHPYIKETTKIPASVCAIIGRYMLIGNIEDMDRGRNHI